MKTIGIDARLYSQTGVGTYLRNFLHFLDNKQFTDLHFLIYMMPADAQTAAFTNPAFTIKPVSFPWHSFSEQTGFYDQLMADNLDLMHFTYFSYPVRYKRPFIATVHDLTPILFKTGRASTKNPVLYFIKQLVFQFVLWSQVQNSRKIITPTKTVKDLLLLHYKGLPEQKIVPLYEGVDYSLAEIKENTELAAIYKNPFLLYVGNFYPHKNVETLIEAFKEVPEPYTLVLSGPNDFFAKKIQELIEQGKLTKRVFLHQNTGRGDVKFFYAHAVALVHPSLSEGFGLPLVEAMAAGLPIIASDIPVFRELLPAGTPFFDPTSSVYIARTLQNYLNQPIKPVYDTVLSRYSFEKMTDDTYSLYQLAVSA